MFDDNSNDPFAGVDEANAKGNRNPYLLDGQYLLNIELLDCFKSRPPSPKMFFLAELKILTSTNPDRPEGLLVSWMTNLLTDMGPINLKRFLAAASGIDPNTDEANTEITKEVCRLAVSKEQPFVGTQVFAQVQTVDTKKIDPATKLPGRFTDVRWIPVTTSTDGSVVIPE